MYKNKDSVHSPQIAYHYTIMLVLAINPITLKTYVVHV